MSRHPTVERAAAGEMPSWAAATPPRRAHACRVADLLDDWAAGRRLPPAERTRWRAAGVLHDALRDAPEAELRRTLGPRRPDLPGAILHGPAAAVHLWDEGVRDGGLLRAVTYHTTGHPDLDALGCALYGADFLEPGRRDARDAWRDRLRARMPDELEEVVGEIARARVAHLLESGVPLLHETVAFWNRLARGGGE